MVEGLGKAGSGDVELFAAVAELVAGPKGADFAAADLARLLWGAGAAGVQVGAPGATQPAWRRRT